MDHETWLEHHDRMIADHEMRGDRDMAELRESQAKTERVLHRAIRLAVVDARRERERNREFDNLHLESREQMKELQQLLKAFLERGGNGKH